MTISIFTLGCKLNQCESASIAADLIKRGYNASEGLLPADVYILNTCSVTAEADKKSRQCIARMRKLNPQCKIIVVGCSSQNAAEKFDKPNVIAVGGTANKNGFIIDIVQSLQSTTSYCAISDRVLYQNLNYATEYEYSEYPISDRTRAFIKIQDGCDRFCSYCIIPYLRGRSRSRSIEDILNECASIDSKEIVLTGVDISYYGKDIGVTLVDLIKALSVLSQRKRLGSLECEAIDDGLLAAMSDNFCPHFHLSLQSGDDAVLRSMNRRYTTEIYRKKVDLIRSYFPSAGITTDIIVGFPTEDERSFERSCDFISACAFADVHVFPYSSRKGTLAANKYAVLPPDVVKSRVSRLLDIKHDLHGRFISRNLGEIMSVYTEEKQGKYNVGYTPNYIKVYSSAPCGEITDIKLDAPYEDGAVGTVVGKCKD